MTVERVEDLLYKNVSVAENISQGDILFNYPVLVPNEDSLNEIEKVSKDELSRVQMDVFDADIIILSQSCDLVLDPERKRYPVDPVICAAIYDIGNYKWETVSETNSGRRPAYFLLNKDGSLMDRSYIIDFGKIFTIPYDVLKKFASTSGDRIRPISPILEKISQHFGNYFSRIGTEYERNRGELKEEHAFLSTKLEELSKQQKSG